MPKKQTHASPIPVAEIEQHIRLTYTQPPSNKEYQANLVRDGDDWSVTFAYGRIGTALKAGAKISRIDYATACQVYTKLVAAKIAEGYLADADESGANTMSAPVAKEDTGLRPQLLDPITLAQIDPFLSDDHWCMQPKFDGNRVFIRAGAESVYGANRKGQKIALPKVVLVWAQAALKHMTDFTLDGELVGEIYHAFDLLSLNGKELTELPYSVRLSLLAQKFRSASSVVMVAETAKSEMDKVALLARLQTEHAEGAVFKSLAARYTPGRQPTQVKCKFWESATFIVRAVNQGVRSVELGLLDPIGKAVQGWGNCTVHSNYAMPSVGALVEVKYLYVDDKVYQPQYLGERTDLERSACVVSQLKFKPGSRHLQTP